MQKEIGNELSDSVFLVDVFITSTVFLLSFWSRDFFIISDEKLSFYSHVFILPLLLALITGCLSYFGGYKTPYRMSFMGYVWAVFRALTISIGVVLALLFFLKIQYISRFVIVVFAIFELVVLLFSRAVIIQYYHRQIKSGKKTLRVLIIGSRARAKDLVSALRRQIAWGVEIIGFLDPDSSVVGTEVMGVPVIGTIDDIHECLKKNVIDEVFIAISRTMLKDAEPIVYACEEEGIRLRFMLDLYSVKVARLTLDKIDAIPMLSMEAVAQDSQQLLAKRLFDFCVTITILPVLLPMVLIVAFLIKFDSPGPVFFVQKRMGLRKKIFKMYKFRSMYIDAEERMKDIEHLNEAEGPIFKIKNDPRITRFGKFLRKTSIDELPQLINILRGDMSLVGPRPMSLRDVALFERAIQRKRFSVQPGLTCLWQISGRSDLTFERWLELDLEYIERWSFWLDLKILLLTIPAVIKAKGAA